VRRAWRILLTVAVLAGVIWYFRDLDVRALRAALARADWTLVAAAGAANLVLNTAARVKRWQALLPPSPRSAQRPRPWFLANVLLASYATNAVLPFRAGEAVRTLALRDRHGYPVMTLVATQLVEKLVEMLSFVSFALPLAFSPVPAAMPTVLGVGACGWLAVLLIVRLARAEHQPHHRLWRRLLGRLGEAVRVLREPGAWLRSFGWALTSHAVDIAMIAMCARALDVHVGFLGWCAVLIAINIAILLPSSPAQLGVLEAGAVIVLASIGVPRDAALAFALAYHAAHVLPTALAGGLALATNQLARVPA